MTFLVAVLFAFIIFVAAYIAIECAALDDDD